MTYFKIYFYEKRNTAGVDIFRHLLAWLYNLTICIIEAVDMEGYLCLTFSWRRPLSYRNQSIDLQNSANQWTGFYVIRVSVMKELSKQMFNKCMKLYSLILLILSSRKPNIAALLFNEMKITADVLYHLRIQNSRKHLH